MGWGTTLTISPPGTASYSTIKARFRCSQHWAAIYTPMGEKTPDSPRKIACATSGVDQLPTWCPTTSLVLHPTTTICPRRRCAASGYASLLLGKGLAAAASIPGNIFQGTVGLVVGVLLVAVLERAKVTEKLA